ncbi:MAG: hybrid sensor histidine kinase/response regulator, partial [Chloroflexi bacterium]|nr:hybrid sensor histidine kinase/response regulator [Chloroflexota bacterium]
MSAAEPTLSPDWSQELDMVTHQLQNETITLALPGLGVAGLLLMIGSSALRHPDVGVLLGISLLLFAAGIWFLHRWNYAVAAWALVIGVLATVLIVICWNGVGVAVGLLVVPVALATVLLSRLAGVAAAGCCTLFVLLVPESLVFVPFQVCVVAIIAIWSIIGIILLALRPLLTTVQWAWSSYRQSQAMLEQARDYQGQLHQALDELTTTNMQLSRLNQHTQSLRQIAEEERHIKERFVANVSHELRTPLNMIIGFCEIITQSPETYGDAVPPALLADLAVVLRNGQHLLSLINDVLDLSQIESRRVSLIKERVSLAEIVQAATIAVRPLYASKDLYLESDIPADLPPVFCDRTRIREVLLNLLSNAGRFTERGGVRVRAWREGGDIVISVADTGPGIAEEDHDKLFKPFQQLDVTVRRHYGGTGLGLTISKNFVELHGGSMWVESVAGQGATVLFRLPIDPPAPVEGGPLRWLNPYRPYEERVRSSILKPVVVRPRLVVIESGTAMQKLLARHLNNVEVVPVADLEEAFQEMKREPVQALLINDLQVDEALQRVSASSRLPYSVPAIICSVPGVEQAAGALGAEDYLVKPISRKMLLETLERVTPDAKTV